MAPSQWPILLLAPALALCLLYAGPFWHQQTEHEGGQDAITEVRFYYSSLNHARIKKRIHRPGNGAGDTQSEVTIFSCLCFFLFILPPFRRRRPLFLLIIGIDTYNSNKIGDLSGAVADATALTTFLSTDSKLPFSVSHATTLTNEQATRETILSELRALVSDDRIQSGDPILVYYAGYGGSFAPKNAKCRTRFIVPYDCDETVAPISDQTIAECIRQLAHIKGNNIVSPFSFTRPALLLNIRSLTNRP